MSGYFVAVQPGRTSDPSPNTTQFQNSMIEIGALRSCQNSHIGSLTWRVKAIMVKNARKKPLENSEPKLLLHHWRNRR